MLLASKNREDKIIIKPIATNEEVNIDEVETANQVASSGQSAEKINQNSISTTIDGIEDTDEFQDF